MRRYFAPPRLPPRLSLTRIYDNIDPAISQARFLDR